jgi:DNA helicase TIP49 (TBP-interacting protein)
MEFLINENMNICRIRGTNQQSPHGIPVDLDVKKKMWKYPMMH